MINGQDFRRSCINSNQANFEDARLLTLSDAEETFEKINLTKGGYELHGPVVANFVRDGERFALVGEPSQVLVIGGTGAGKTSCYFQTQLEAYARSKNKPSAFVMDVKGDMFREKCELLRECGYETYVLNFSRPFDSARYNPLSAVYKIYAEARKLERDISLADGTEREYNGVTYEDFDAWRGALEQDYFSKLDYCQNELINIAKIISPIESKKDPTWDMGSQNIIFSMLWGLLEDSDNELFEMTEEKYTLNNLINTAYATDSDCDHLNAWARMHDVESPARNLVAYYDLHAKATRDSYINNTNNKLNKFANIPMKALTAASDVDVEAMARTIAERPVAIFCITDESRSVTYDLCLMFINHLLTTLQRYADSIGGSLKTDFHFLLDEFANMPTLPNAQKWISTLRSRRVWMHLGIQSFDQLDELYGEHGRGIIVDNCNTQIYFGCNNVATTKDYAESLGLHCVTNTSLSFSPTGEISTSFSPATALLVRQSDLTSLKLGEAYVRCFRNNALKTYLEPNFRCEDFAHGNAVPAKVTKNLDFLEGAYYDIHETIKNDPDDDDDDGFMFDREKLEKTLKKKIDKLTEEEKELLKDLFSLTKKELAQNRLQSHADKIRPHARSLVEKGVLRVKKGRFFIALGQNSYDLLREYLFTGEFPKPKEDPGDSFRRRRSDFF